MKFKINLELLPIKGHYLFYNAALVMVVPQLSVIAKQIGFSGTIVGMIYATGTFCSMLLKPIMGGIADKYKIKKKMFITYQIITAFALFPINFIPMLPSESKMLVYCDGGILKISSSPKKDNNIPKNFLKDLKEDKGENGIINCQMDCPIQFMFNFEFKRSDSSKKHITGTVRVSEILISNNIFSFPLYNASNTMETGSCSNLSENICDVKFDSKVVNEYLQTRKEVTVIKMMKYSQFWWFIIFFIIGWTSMSVTVSLSDAICIEMLEDDIHRYGNQRVCGALGWGSFSLLGGLLVDSLSIDENHKNYLSAFILMIILTICSVICSKRIKYVQHHKTPYEIYNIKKILCHVRVIVFLICAIVVGMCTAVIWDYLFWYVEELAMKKNAFSKVKTIEALIIVLQTLFGEVILFYLSGWIIKKIGHILCMVIVLFTLSARFLLYTTIKNPWHIIPIEFSNGITFGLFYSTMVSFAGKISFHTTEATIQGLFSSMFDGVGTAIGGLVGGAITDLYGLKSLFLIFGISMFLIGIVNIIVQIIISKQAKHNQDNDNENNGENSENYNRN